MRASLLPVTATALLSLALCLSCKVNGGDGGDGGDGDGDTDTDTAACEGFADVQADAPIEVFVINERAEPIYLLTPGDCTHNYVHITNPMGHWPAGDCEPTCTALMLGSCACPGACAAPQLLRIEPGGEYPLDWSYLFVDDSVPDSCVATDLCQAGACPRSVAPPDGDYTISARVSFMPEECADASDPCACDGPDSWCLTDVIAEGAPVDEMAEAVISLPGDGPAVLLIN